jgi:hypothetical protein
MAKIKLKKTAAKADTTAPVKQKPAKLSVARVREISDSLDKRATFERQTSDMIGSGMDAAKKVGKKTDYMGRDEKQNNEAIISRLNKADILNSNAARYRSLANSASKKK